MWEQCEYHPHTPGNIAVTLQQPNITPLSSSWGHAAKIFIYLIYFLPILFLFSLTIILTYQPLYIIPTFRGD